MGDIEHAGTDAGMGQAPRRIQQVFGIVRAIIYFLAELAIGSLADGAGPGRQR